ncbi:hypothetical protein VUR80DRAFT_3365 [Thermomyces stellatus]
MPTTGHSNGKSSRTRSKTRPSFLDELAFVTVATPEERKKLREKRLGGNKAACREEKKHKKHTTTRDVTKELEIVSGSNSVENDRRHGGGANWRHSRGWHARGSVIDRSSVDVDGSRASLRPLSLTGGEELLRKEATNRWGSADTEDSGFFEWGTAPNSLYSRGNCTARQSSEGRAAFEDGLDGIKRLSLSERRERVRDKFMGQGSWRRDARQRHEPTQSRRKSYSGPPKPKESPKLRRPSPPGAWPSSPARTQETGIPRRHTSLSQERDPRERTLWTETVRAPESAPVAQRGQMDVAVEGKDGKICRGTPAVKVPAHLRDPNAIRPRRPKRRSSGHRHLRPGMPLTERNLMQHTVAGGGEKGYKAKSCGWMGCTGADPDVESEASLWDGGATKELEPWDSVSVRDMRRYYASRGAVAVSSSKVDFLAQHYCVQTKDSLWAGC